MGLALPNTDLVDTLIQTKTLIYANTPMASFESLSPPGGDGESRPKEAWDRRPRSLSTCSSGRRCGSVCSEAPMTLNCRFSRLSEGLRIRVRVGALVLKNTAFRTSTSRVEGFPKRIPQL